MLTAVGISGALAFAGTLTLLVLRVRTNLIASWVPARLHLGLYLAPPVCAVLAAFDPIVTAATVAHLVAGVTVFGTVRRRRPVAEQGDRRHRLRLDSSALVIWATGFLLLQSLGDGGFDANSNVTVVSLGGTLALLVAYELPDLGGASLTWRDVARLWLAGMALLCVAAASTTASSGAVAIAACVAACVFVALVEPVRRRARRAR